MFGHSRNRYKRGMARMGGYMRVSRKAGRDEDVWLTIPIQRDGITSWCTRNGHELADLRQDVDVSGGSMERANLEALVVAIEHGDLDGLVVGKLDRFAREMAGGARVISRIERAGGWFVAAGDGIVIGPNGRDDSGADDNARLTLNIMLAIADHFLRANKSMWRETRRRTIERGAIWGPHIPLGYRRGDGNVLVVDPATAPIVLEVFARRYAGQNDGQIVRWLTELGVKTGRGRQPTHRWVAALIRQRAYLGESRAGEFVNLEAHEPIVPRELWDQAQITRRRRSAPREVLDKPILSGLLRCHGCRGTMTSAVTIKDGQRLRTYRCRGLYANGQCPAPATIVERDLLARVEEVFWLIIGGDIEFVEHVGPTVDQAGLLIERDKAERALITYRDDPDILDQVEPRIYAQGLTVRQERFDQADKAVRSAEPRRPTSDVPTASLRADWEYLTVDERNEAFHHAIGCIVVMRSGERYTPELERVPLRSRTALLLVEDLPDDLPRSGSRGQPLRPFPSFDDPSAAYRSLFP